MYVALKNLSIRKWKFDFENKKYIVHVKEKKIDKHNIMNALGLGLVLLCTGPKLHP